MAYELIDVGIAHCMGELVGDGGLLVVEGETEVDYIPVAHRLFPRHDAVVGVDAQVFQYYPHRECPQLVQMRHPS